MTTRTRPVSGSSCFDLRALLGRAAALVVAIALPFGTYFAVERATSSRLFIVQSVEITGIERVSRDEIEAAAGLQRPRNTLTVGADAVREGVESLDWVRSATVLVGLDGRVAITVEERELRALVLASSPVLVDAAGETIRLWRPGDRTDLPVLIGMTKETPDGRVPDPARVLEAYGILDAFASSTIGSGRRVIEVQERGPHGFIVVLDDGVEVRLGADRLEERIGRLDEALAEVGQAGRSATYVVLDGRSIDRVAVGVESVGGRGGERGGQR